MLTNRCLWYSALDNHKNGSYRLTVSVKVSYTWWANLVTYEKAIPEGTDCFFVFSLTWPCCWLVKLFSIMQVLFITLEMISTTLCSMFRVKWNHVPCFALLIVLSTLSICLTILLLFQPIRSYDPFLFLVLNSWAMGGSCSRKRDQVVDEDVLHRGPSGRYCKSGSSKWLGTSFCPVLDAQQGGRRPPSLMDLCIDKICQVISCAISVSTWGSRLNLELIFASVISGNWQVQWLFYDTKGYHSANL